ncbi:hypothetical protein ACJMK2_011262 [Sinanodonta woodiana]|uniref:HEAT repeat-containing protein 6 n=1 Tax=Sinanodonta woodiana TaxID=1069815 RepID=A0ABD3V4D8_SINWO
MATNADDFELSERAKFQHCYNKLRTFYFRDDEASKTNLNILLDELIALEYSWIIVKTEEANLLLTKLCGTVPIHQERLVVKVCQIIHNFRMKQKIALEERCLDLLTDYIVKALHRCPAWVQTETLKAFASVLYENCDRVSKSLETLLGRHGILVQLVTLPTQDEDVFREAVQCLECLTTRPASGDYMEEKYALICFRMFTNLLHQTQSAKLDPFAKCKILINCLRGLQNILQVTKAMPVDQLGPVLAAVRAYMFYGLCNQMPSVPESLYPAAYGQLDVLNAQKGDENTEAIGEPKGCKTQGQKKGRKKRNKKAGVKGDLDNDHLVSLDEEAVHLVTSVSLKTNEDPVFQPAWAKVSSSDSDWSDTEGGQGSKFRAYCTRVRQSSLGCLHCIIKTTDKKVMFGYWSSFIPDSPHTSSSSEQQSLFTIIMKDAAPKCRLGALTALTSLLDGTKPLLAMADDSEDVSMAFTPFSVILGSTIKELHRCLLLAMLAENFPITLTQLIKCLGTLIANVPYHRLRPGLLTRIVKQIRHFFNHRDPNVRVACLTCLGAMASIQPPLMEICHIIQPSHPPVGTHYMNPAELERSNPKIASTPGINSIQSASSSDSSHIEGEKVPGHMSSSSSPGVITPGQGSSSSGIQTPYFSDQTLQAHARDISWVVKLCLRNILPQKNVDRNGKEIDSGYFEPLPVRLESLQVLAHLTKGYFPIIRSSVTLLQEVIHKCYQERDPVVQLHVAKVLEEFTQVLLQDVQSSEKVTSPDRLNRQEVLDFWMSLLNGPVPAVLQVPVNNPVRATTCDCLANIGADTFIALPMDKRILIITLLLGLTSDEDKAVRSSAIRTLGVFVLYRNLREDVSFMSDATNAILSGIDDKSIAVRVKAAWSLANLCDALALNRDEGDGEFMEEFPDGLLYKIITMATKSCLDNDKVKSNSVRAIGNVLKYLPPRSINKENFVNAIAEGIKALVKNIGSGAMKVRWNACYATSNIFKNRDLPHGSVSWTSDILNALCCAVKECKNFKVRINAALGLTSLEERSQFGSVQIFSAVWSNLITALKAAGEITDFAEYRYRDNLIDQVCAALVHMMSLLTPDDLICLHASVERDGDFLMEYLEKYRTTMPMLSQIGMYVSPAISRLTKLTNGQLSDETQTCLQVLLAMCQRLVMPDEGEVPERTTEKSAFIQTYD